MLYNKLNREVLPIMALVAMLVSIPMAIKMRLGAAVVFTNIVVLGMSAFVYAIITLFQNMPNLYIGIDKTSGERKSKVVDNVKRVCFWTKSVVLVLLATFVIIATLCK